MARMNNQVRSLQIIAKQNGWDPNEFMGNLHSYNEDRVNTGDSRTIPDFVKEPTPSNANGGINFEQPQTDAPLTSHKTTNADPYAGKGGPNG